MAVNFSKIFFGEFSEASTRSIFLSLLPTATLASLPAEGGTPGTVQLTPQVKFKLSDEISSL